MNRDLYSNSEFQLLKRRLNKEIMRRATYRWWDPLVTPRVGQDRSSPLSLPEDQERVLVDNNTYTINTPSHGSIEPVKNDQYPNRGDTLAGTEYDHTPVSSSSRVTVDEIKNLPTSHVHLLGARSNPRDYMVAADAFCLSSLYEGMPITLIECLSVGAIPICTPVGGIKNMIEDGVNGLLAKGTSVTDLKDVILRFLEMGEEEKRHGIIQVMEV